MKLKRIGMLSVGLALAMAHSVQAQQMADRAHSVATTYVTFPAAIDPDHLHRHVLMQRGSRLYHRPQIVMRQMIRSRAAGDVEQVILVDAASVITRLPGETLVVEPDGSKWRLSPVAAVRHGERLYKYVVIPPNVPVPDYLRSVRPDVDVR